MKANIKEQKIIRQYDQSDCGVACLLSIIRYYDGSNTLENLRKLSGTNITGTTLLGLYQAANQLGFDAEGCEASVETLTAHDTPCILHINSNHYVVCFGTQKEKDCKFIIGDPAQGTIYLNKQQLDEIWVTKKCLALLPNEKFKKAAELVLEKRKWTVELVKTDITLLAVAVGLGVSIAILSMVMAVFSQRLVDEILPKQLFLKLNIGIALVFILLLIKEGLTALRQYFLLRQSKDFNIRITDFFYTHLLKLPKPFFDTRKIGELTARLNDTTRIQRVISQLAGNVVIDVLMVVVSTTFVFIYSWQVGIACLVAAPVFFLLIYFHNKRIIDGQRAIMRSYATTESNYISTLQGIEPIKNYNKQSLFSLINKSIYQAYQDNIFSLGKISIKLSFLANGFGVSFLLAVLAFTSYRVIHQQLKIGELMAILGMCGALLPSVSNLALVSIPINEAKVAFDRMFEFTSTEAEKQEETHDITSINNVKVQNIAFRFAGRPPIIRNVSFEVNKGEIIAIMGENGSGKSTITQILQKHYSAETGQIILNNQVVLNSIDSTLWRNMVGVVPQNIHIFNGSVLENIAFDDTQNNIQAVLNFLQEYGFAGFIESLPQSLLTIVGEEGINLSGGQKQMIAFARALYHKPQILILDEATAAMDRQSEQFVLQLLRQLKKEIGIIFITHRLHVLKSFCDRIYILENGSITTQGSHHQLLQTQNM